MNDYMHSFSSIEDLAGEEPRKKKTLFDLIKHLTFYVRRKLQNGI